MNITGYRYQLQKKTGTRWQTVASSDDLKIIEKLFRDQDGPTRATTSWRVVDRPIDKILREVTVHGV